MSCTPRREDGSASRCSCIDRPGFAPIAIGLGLTLIHLIGIPVTNLSVNPARSTGPALVGGGTALAQRWPSAPAPSAPARSPAAWLFRVAPLAGAILHAAIHGWVGAAQPAQHVEPGLRPAPVEPVAD